jgi:hypothetical protein
MIASFIIHYASWQAARGLGQLSKMAVTRQLDLIAWSREESRLTFLRVADDSDGGQRKGVRSA